MLGLGLVIACGGAGRSLNGRCDISAAADAFHGAEVDVKSVGAFASRGGARNGNNAVSVAKVVSDGGVGVGAAAVIINIVVADGGVGTGGASNVI